MYWALTKVWVNSKGLEKGQVDLEGGMLNFSTIAFFLKKVKFMLEKSIFAT